MRSGRRTLVLAAAVLVVGAAATGCSTSGRQRTLHLGASDSASPVAGTGSVEEWIAVFRTEADPQDLSEDTAEILPVVDGAIVVSPIACFEGLPAELALDSYLLGVVAPTKDALDQIVVQVDRKVIFEGRVRTMCLD